jgi:hypothetical protein
MLHLHIVMETYPSLITLSFCLWIPILIPSQQSHNFLVSLILHVRNIDWEPMIFNDSRLRCHFVTECYLWRYNINIDACTAGGKVKLHRPRTRTTTPSYKMYYMQAYSATTEILPYPMYHHSGLPSGLATLPTCVDWQSDVLPQVILDGVPYFIFKLLQEEQGWTKPRGHYHGNNVHNPYCCHGTQGNQLISTDKYQKLVDIPIIVGVLG